MLLRRRRSIGGPRKFNKKVMFAVNWGRRESTGVGER
jgi:hypothetical protein